MVKQIKKEVLSETILLIFIAAVATIYYSNSIRFDRFEQVFFLFFAYWILIIFIAYRIYKLLAADIKRIKLEREQSPQTEAIEEQDEVAISELKGGEEEKKTSVLSWLHDNKVLSFIIFIGLYLLSSIWVNIFITTFFFLLVCLWFYGTKPLHSLIISLVTTVGCYALFSLWLDLI